MELNKYFQKIKEYLKINYLPILICFLSLIIISYISLFQVQWDNLVYLSNAKYFLGLGSFFEMIRPPLTSLVLMLFVWINAQFALFLFILLTLILSYFVFKKYSKLLKIDFVLFLLLIFNPITLNFGFRAGPDFLTIVFLVLAIIMLILNKNAGIFLGLSCLLRYNAFPYVLMLFIRPKFKDLLKNILGFLVIILPWLIYNKIKYGNFFASIIQNYAENFLLRTSLPINWQDLIFNLNYVVIIFIIILIIYIYKKDFKLSKFQKIALISTSIIALFSLYSFFTFSVTEYRLLMPLSLFFATFASIFAIKISKNQLKIIKIILIILLSLTIIFSFLLQPHNKLNTFSNTQKEVEKIIDYKNCQTYSNNWVILNYYGFDAKYLPEDEKSIKNILDNNSLIIIFPQSSNIEFLKDNYNNNLFFILGNENNCKLNDSKTIHFFDYCSYFSNNIINKTCNLLNIN